MAALTFYVAIGRINELAQRVIDADPPGNNLFIAYYTGTIQADATLQAHLTKSAVDAANTVALFTNYGTDATRKLTSVTRTITSDEQWCDSADMTISSAGGTVNETITRAILYYDDVTGAGFAQAEIAGIPAGTVVPGIATQNWEVDVTIDGGSLQQLALAVNIADDYDTIAATMSTAITGGTCAFVGGMFVVTSATTGNGSTAVVAAGTLGTTSDMFAAITAAAAGNPTITFPTPGRTTDNAIPLAHYQFDYTTTGANMSFAPGAAGLYRSG